MADLELEIVSTADSRGLTQAARDTDRLRGSTEKLGHEFHDTAMDSRELDQKITSLRSSVRSLGTEFARTQGPSIRSDLRSERSMLAELERIRKELEDQAPGMGVTIGSAIGSRAGVAGANSFTKSFGEQLTAGGRLATISRIVALASPLLVPLGAMASGLILGTVGGGGVIGGIALASRDPRVKAEWKKFGRSIVADTDVATAPFIEPTIRGIETVAATWRSIQPEMKSIFADFAKGVEPLAEGIAGFLREAVPGFRAAARAAQPFMEVLAEDLPELSEDISAFFQALERGAPGAAQGLHDFITIIGNGLRTVGFLLEGASRWWEKIRHEPWRLAPVAMPITGFQILVDQIRDLDAMQDAGATTANAFALGLDAGAEAAGAAAKAIGGQAKSFADLRREIFLTSDAYGDFIGIQLNQDQANLRVKQGLFELERQLKRTNFDFRDNTEAGLANQAMVLDMIGRFNEQRQANSTTAESTAKATDEFWKQVDSLSGIAGKSKTAKDFLEKLKGRYKITIMWEQIGQAVGQAGQFIASQFKKLFSFQGGGTTPAFAPFQVHDGEMLFSDRQHYVASKSQMQRFGSMGGSDGSSMTTVAPLVVTDPLGALVVDEIRRVVQNRGGQLAVLGLKPSSN